MFDILLYILVGILVGAIVPLFYCRARSQKELEAARVEAMEHLYREIMKKKQSSDFRYSKEVRRAIDRVHAYQKLQ